MSSFLDDMAVFAAVVRDGSFTAAGRSLGITKQSVSERIARLEERLGVQLLVRTTRALRLTEVGTRYHEACATIVAEADRADREARGAQQHAAGTVRVTAPIGLGAPLLFPAARELRRLHPEVRLELVLDESIVDLVRDGVDLAIRAGSVESTPTFIARPLFETPRAIVATPELLAAQDVGRARSRKPHEPRSAAATLETLPCIARRRDDTWTVDGHRIAIAAAVTVNTFEGAREAALAGIGVAQIPLPIVLEDLRAGRLTLLFRPTRGISFTVLWPSKRLPVRVRLFHDLLVQRAKDLVASIESVLQDVPSVP